MRDLTAKSYETPMTSQSMRRANEGLFHFSVKQFFFALLLMLIAAPFLEHIRSGIIIESVLMTGVLLSGVLAVGGRRKSLLIAAALVAPAIFIRWVNLYRPDLLPQTVPPFCAMAFMAYVTAHLLWFIIRSPQVNSEVLYAAVSAYLMIAIFWSFAYILTAKLNPDAFAFNGSAAADFKMIGLNALYFSLVTLASVGYGDISPVSSVAKMLAVMEAVAGLFYMAILIARLVAAYTSAKAGMPRSD